MKQNKSAIIGFLFVLFVLAIFITSRQLVNPKDTANLITENPQTNTQEVGTSETIIQYTNHYSYTIFYPLIGKPNIDLSLKDLTDSFISNFLIEYEQYKAKSLEERATLTVTYHTYLTGGHILSVVFMLEDYNPKLADLSQDVYIVNYNMEKDEALHMEDYFQPAYTTLLSDKFKEYLLTIPEYKDSFTGEAFLPESLTDGNSTPFFFTNAGITICMDVLNTDTNQFELVEYPIPIDDLLTVLKQSPFGSEPVDYAGADDGGDGAPASVDIPPVDPDKPMVALTFDDGPLGKVTNRILDVLEENQSRATFFVLGARLKKEKATVKRAISLGCQIGNHSYSHKSLTSLNKKALKYEIEQTNAVLEKITSQTTKILRPPFGSVNSKVRKHADYPLIHWSVDTMDWKTNNKKKTIKHTLNHIKDGDVVLMHDLYDSTADACETIIPRLIEDGYQLVTVKELFENKGIRLKKGKSFYSAR